MKKKDVKIFASIIDETSKKQIEELSNLEAFKGEKIRIMPDTHAGASCVIGFTSTYSDKIIPNIVGVDLSCGMLTIDLGKVDIDFPKLDKFIKSTIPMGQNINEEAYDNYEMMLLDEQIKNLHCYDKLKNKSELLKGVGSLGGGKNDCFQVS